jgi:hypothetical protein
LIEILVVIAIIGVMLSLLLPALNAVRATADAAACENNVRQLHMALRQSIETTKRFPLVNRWPVDSLRWMEEEPLYRQLYQEMKENFNPSAEFPRPALLRCPRQEDFPSRVTSVGFSHYLLVVDRPLQGRPEKVRWEIQDRELLTDDEPQEPWFIAPEISFAERGRLLNEQPGPHPPGLYMTIHGLWPLQ